VDDQSSLGPMFDSPRGLTPVPSRLRAALVLSVATHLALLVVAVLLGRPVPVATPREGPIHFPPLGAGPRGGPPTVTPTALPRGRTPVPPRKAVHLPRPEARPPQTPSAVAIPSAPEDSPPADVPGEPGDGHDSPPRPGGCPGAVCPGGGGGGGEIVSESIVAALPVFVSGPPVRLPASAHGLTGTMQVVCVITVAGTVSDCEVQVGAPLAEAAVLAALHARTYRPAQLEGRPVAVRHVFKVPLELGR